MPQTLSIFLAMLVLVTFSVSQQRSIMQTYGQAYDREATMAATDFTLQRFAEMQGKQYDASVSNTTRGRVDPVSLSSSPQQEDGPGDFNDIDDYHNEDGEPVTHEMNGQTYDFLVVTTVTYDVAAQEKDVTIEVYEDEAAKDAGHFRVQLARTYTLSGVAA